MDVPFNKTSTEPYNYGIGTYSMQIIQNVPMGQGRLVTPKEGRWIPPIVEAWVSVEIDKELRTLDDNGCIVYGNFINNATPADKEKLLKEQTKTLEALRALGVKVTPPKQAKQ